MDIDHAKCKVEIRYNKFYPLVKYTIDTIVWMDGHKHSTRRVSRSDKYNNKWYLYAISRLYARQIAKLQNRKSLMELPYIVENIFDTDIIETEYDKIISCFNEYGTRIIDKSNTSSKEKVQISGEEILENELFGE